MSADYYMALDVGTKRIGVALAHSIARLPRPLTTLQASAGSMGEIVELVRTEGVRELIVGLPRSLDGTASAQTRYSEDFAHELQAAVTIPVHLVDETLTSVQAEAELANRTHVRGDIDALAACFILERFLEKHQETARL